MDDSGRSAPPGWYPDQEGNGLRFWDGRTWSGLSGDTELLEGPDGRLLVRGTELETDYSYRAVARLAERRRTLRATEPWTRSTA